MELRVVALPSQYKNFTMKTGLLHFRFTSIGFSEETGLQTSLFFCKIYCEHNAGNKNENYRKDHRNDKEAYEDLLLYQSIKINLQR